MVFQLFFDSFTLNALKTGGIGPCVDILLILVVVWLKIWFLAMRLTDFELNMEHRHKKLTDRIWVIPVRSGASSSDKVTVVLHVI